MNISPNEAEEALAAIEKTMQRTRRSFADSGAYVFLLITGMVWLVGFLATQFLSGPEVAYIWIGASVMGSLLSIPLGRRMGRQVRAPSTPVYAKRIGTFWAILILYGIAIIAITRPADGKQVTLLVILFIMLGQLATGLLLSFSSTWWTLAISALAVAGYFLLPGYFYLWMALLGGGGMIAMALYIRSRW
jgi:hypothetical protein